MVPTEDLLCILLQAPWGPRILWHTPPTPKLRNALKLINILKNCLPLCAWVFCLHLHVYLCTVCMPGTHGVQKRASNSPSIRVTDGCELPCGCWESNWGPLKEHVLSSTVPTLQPLNHTLKLHTVTKINKMTEKSCIFTPVEHAIGRLGLESLSTLSSVKYLSSVCCLFFAPRKGEQILHSPFIQCIFP